MHTALIEPPPAVLRTRAKHRIPPLENGARLGAAEFLRRYEEMPPSFKAELIDGIVYLMSPPLSAEHHGEPDSLLQTWLGTYAVETPGVKSATNSTTRLGGDDVPQPDASLRILHSHGGRARIGGNGYLEGPPELVVEIAASSASIDVRSKLSSYRRAGVQEYLVWRTEDGAIDWWQLEEDEYRPIPAQADGTVRSRVFPGLWLDVPAALADNGAKILVTLRRGLRGAKHTAFVAELKHRAAKPPRDR